MSIESVVDFPTASRVHVALAVQDIERAGAFYRALLGVEPSKSRPGYLRFEATEPPLNLALNRSASATGQVDPQHFGIQVKSTDSVAAARQRMEQAGYATQVEDQVSCCYAVQDKVWIRDPDGHRWEVYVVTNDDSEQYASSAATKERTCCEPSCCQ